MPSKPDPFSSSVWTHPPRGRGTQPPLSRDQIVRAAIELLDAEGAAGLSMRRLGTKLGSGATSVYWYVAHKDELLELAVDQVMGEVYVPDPDDTGWRIGASVFTSGLRAMLLRHPWVIGLLGVRPAMGPNAMRNGDRMVALLSAAGFSGLELAHASSLLMAYAIGSASTVAALTSTSREAGVPVTEIVTRIEPYLDLIAADHPHYDKWRREIGPAARDPERVWEDGFMFGLERLLDGLELWLSRRTGG
ncbi:TetR/AcrR family transcriptional regulator [Jidongwangia harbinensis]|uniref:TetR/AcrR family transcriptional regulator n=1 Tax=Jidongwangia harbinensis TaxID=2878561 RepID=UPI001CD939C6|nr:TetR/AcrR family transcriptional regulator [Jidongwangia harbinensis]MCA2214381.1 TetR/AcrR family transcriptional regulator [Jidongwangia harbinensis]